MKHNCKDKKMAKTWYAAEGLCFECQGCGGCCEGPGGYVWINDEEIAAMATVKGISIAEFNRLYVRVVFERTALIDNACGDCIFLVNKRCEVYAARPRQCRTFPWWPELLRSEKAWNDNNYNCPGINRGKKYSAAEIIARCAENKEK